MKMSLIPGFAAPLMPLMALPATGLAAPESGGPQSGQPATEPTIEPGRGAYIGGAPHQLSAQEAAKQLANPNTPQASLTLESQWTHWEGSLLGSDGMDSQTFLFQPSFPFPVSETDSIFFRPAFPYLVDQPVVEAPGNVRTETGFGDMGMDLAFGRASKTGFLTAAGLVAGIPIGADRLSRDTWTLGPELFVGKISKKGVFGFNIIPVVPNVVAQWLSGK